MSLVNPVSGANFYVYFLNANPSSGLEWAEMFIGGAVSAALSFITGAFSEVIGLDSDMEVEEYKEGGRNGAPHKFYSNGRYTPLQLKRGVTMNPDLWDWHYTFLNGTLNPIRKHGMILLADQGWGGNPATPIGLPVVDKPPIAAWFFVNGLPQKLSGPRLAAGTNQIAVEELHIAHEGLHRLGAGLLPGGVGDVAAGFGL